MSTAGNDDRLHPEQRARVQIDAMLEAAGWVVQNLRDLNLWAGTGVAVRELLTDAGPADYVLFVNRQAVGVIEAKGKGRTLSGVEWQTAKYQANVPEALPAVLVGGRLPYGYESTGSETWFTCRMDPEPTARRVFWFHRPETLEREIEDHRPGRGGSLRAQIPTMAPLEHEPGRLRDAQFEAITNLERSLQQNNARALIQMATGSGTTFAVVGEWGGRRSGPRAAGPGRRPRRAARWPGVFGRSPEASRQEVTDAVEHPDRGDDDQSLVGVGAHEQHRRRGGALGSHTGTYSRPRPSTAT